jgi:hypothetical protein
MNIKLEKVVSEKFYKFKTGVFCSDVCKLDSIKPTTNFYIGKCLKETLLDPIEQHINSFHVLRHAHPLD